MGVSLSADRRRTKPFRSEQLQQLAAEFCLDHDQVEQIYQCFSRLLTAPKAYLELDDLAHTLHHAHPHFSELPYLQRLFTLVSRKTPAKLFFEDYLAGISTFCLMNSEAVLRFVFEWLDSDGDDRISQEDIRTAAHYAHPASQQKTFFHNFLPALERYAPGLMDFEAFRKLSTHLPFLVWPAYQLQEQLRQINLGEEFWMEQYARIEKAELALKNSEKKAYRMLEKVKQLTAIRTQQNCQLQVLRNPNARKANQASTDLQLLPPRVSQRRRSCPILKSKLLPVDKLHESQPAD